MKIFGAKVHIIIRSVPVCQFLAREFKFLGLFTFATLSAAAFSAKIQFEILIQIWILRLFINKFLLTLKVFPSAMSLTSSNCPLFLSWFMPWITKFGWLTKSKSSGWLLLDSILVLIGILQVLTSMVLTLFSSSWSSSGMTLTLVSYFWLLEDPLPYKDAHC